MTPVEIQAMARGIAEASAGNMQWLGYLIAAISGGALSFLGGYLGEKGKGMATKEDVEKITRKVEDVKNEYVRQIEDLKAHHQLRLVAAERRLQSHQEAFEKWVHLYDAVVKENDDETARQVIACQHWIAKNCIYLTSKSRGAFHYAFQFALAHKQIKKTENAKNFLEKWQRFESTGNIFLSETLLPTLDADELRAVIKVTN